MGRGKRIWKEKKGAIRVLYVRGLSHRVITAGVVVSKLFVSKYLKGLGVARVNKKFGRSQKLS